MVGEISLLSENYGIEANKYGKTETVLWDRRGKYPYYAVGGIWDNLTLKGLQ